jgi:hypothetical protein
MSNQYYGEISWYETDFAGTSGYKANFDTVLEVDANNNWTSVPFSNSGWSKSQETCFAQEYDVPNSTTFQTWTDPLVRNPGNSC